MKNNTTTLIALCASLTACTQQQLETFRFAQQNEEFSIGSRLNTKIDLLWVVDNSASMDVSQEKLRQGFAAFANKYMLPTWDIRVAVITTDTYLANSFFTPYLDATIPGTTGWTTAYLTANKATWTNPTWNATLFDNVGGTFTGGLKYKEVVPAWGATGELYSRLLPGLHDGPIAGLCSEATPTLYFYNGASNCSVRDLPGANTGVDGCLNPGAGETSASQCVNTVQNDTVRSGKAILSTLPPAGTPADSAWTEQLVKDFKINLTTGSAGHGSERGLGSVLQLIEDNETTATQFFRAGSVRGLIFVTDEDDQTFDLPQSGTTSPLGRYKCDQALLTTLNPTKNISGAGGYCCAAGCTYGSNGTSCESKTVDGVTIQTGICPLQNELKSVSAIKNEYDEFFLGLDGLTPGVDPKLANYFVAAIVPKTAASIQSLNADRTTEDTTVGGVIVNAVDRGDRYIELASLVQNNSVTLDIGSSNYTSVLDAVGRAIVARAGRLVLTRPPTSAEEMIVTIYFTAGQTVTLGTHQFSIDGNILSINDTDLVLSLQANDRVTVNYQPRTAN